MSQATPGTIETRVVDGLALAKSIRKELAEEIGALVAAGHRAPCLAVVLVGADPASQSYIKGKQRACTSIGMGSIEHLLPADTSQAALLTLLGELNADDGIDGILVQLPLTKQIDPNVIAQAIDPSKDADALHPMTAGLTLKGLAELISCTPLGVMEVLDRYNVPLEAGLDRFVKREQGGFIGHEAIEKRAAQGHARQLIGFELEDRGVARADYAILSDGEEVGIVTSGAPSPTLGKSIGLGYVRRSFAEVGTSIEIEVRGKGLAARIVETPFVRARKKSAKATPQKQ